MVSEEEQIPETHPELHPSPSFLIPFSNIKASFCPLRGLATSSPSSQGAPEVKEAEGPGCESQDSGPALPGPRAPDKPPNRPHQTSRTPTPLTGKSRCGQFAGQAGLIRPLFPPPATPFLILASLSLGAPACHTRLHHSHFPVAHGPDAPLGLGGLRDTNFHAGLFLNLQPLGQADAQ